MEQEVTSSSQAGNPIKNENQKFCYECGEKIKKKAVVCPHCGVKQEGQVSKIALVLLTFFLGGFGIHKFYLGKNWQGVFYVLFFWTGIPGLIALIELIIYLFTSSERLNEKYTANGSPVIIAIIAIVVGVIITGILAAIAIPQFMLYRERAQARSQQSAAVQALSLEQIAPPVRG